MPETPQNVPAGDGVSRQFEKGPLEGRLILLTRPIEQAGSMSDRLSRLGAEVMLQPAITIAQPADWGGVDAAIEKIEDYHWLVFSSANGVRYLLGRIMQRDGDLKRLTGVKLAATGPKTADQLVEFGLQTDLIPELYRAEALAEVLVEHADGNRFLLARASRGREVLAERLSAAGGIVEQIVVYASEDAKEPDPEVEKALAAGKIDWVTATSSAIARSLAALFGDQLKKSKVASISPLTSQTLIGLGIQPAVEAAEYTMEGLISAIVDRESADS